MARSIKTISETRLLIEEYKKNGKSVGFVPTMGALHIGHESLIKQAKKECDVVVVSIFVNPTQFGPDEDYDKYPRQFDKDKDICEKNGVDLIFHPEVSEMYPEENKTKVIPPESFKNLLCGKTRKGHFDGVAMVVLKLFNIITPDKAFFGMKDAQQVAIIKKMVRDLNVPIEIIGCPIIRDADGLACSSRNQYLSNKARQKALSINKALKKVKDMYDSGRYQTKEVINQVKDTLDKSIEIEYVEAIDFDTFLPAPHLKNNTLIALAIKIDGVRLIDNILI